MYIAGPRSNISVVSVTHLFLRRVHVLLGCGSIHTSCCRHGTLNSWICHFEVEAMTLSSNWFNVSIDMGSKVGVVVRGDVWLSQVSNTVGRFAIILSDSCCIGTAIKERSVSEIDQSSSDHPSFQRSHRRRRLKRISMLINLFVHIMHV